MLILAKMLAKYFIIIYALGSVHEKFGVWNKAVPRSKFPAWLGVKNGRRTFHVLLKFYVLGSAHEKIGIWTGPKIVVRI